MEKLVGGGDLGLKSHFIPPFLKNPLIPIIKTPIFTDDPNFNILLEDKDLDLNL